MLNYKDIYFDLQINNKYFSVTRDENSNYYYRLKLLSLEIQYKEKKIIIKPFMYNDSIFSIFHFFDYLNSDI